MTSKLSLLTSVAAGALALGLAASPASAFDKLNWEWDLHIDENVTKDIDIDANIDPTGLALLENIQVQVGDVNARSVVEGVRNNQYAPDGSNGTVDFTVEFDNPVDDSSDPGTYSGTASLGGDLSGTGGISGEIDEGSDRVNGTATFTDVAVTLDPSVTFDARTELPEIVSAATAVGNNSSIESDVAVEVHEGQFLFDVHDQPEFGLEEAVAAVGIYELFDNNYGDVNTNHLLGASVLIAGVGGLIDKADISAVSRVENILNASVDSSATAVGNNKSITIDPAGATDFAASGNSLLMGDITQVSLADVSATSSVSNINLNNYTNLRRIDPVVNSVATAVGNNLSVTLQNGSLADD